MYPPRVYNQQLTIVLRRFRTRRRDLRGIRGAAPRGPRSIAPRRLLPQVGGLDREVHSHRRGHQDHGSDLVSSPHRRHPARRRLRHRSSLGGAAGSSGLEPPTTIEAGTSDIIGGGGAASGPATAGVGPSWPAASSSTYSRRAVKPLLTGECGHRLAASLPLVEDRVGRRPRSTWPAADQAIVGASTRIAPRQARPVRPPARS